jgi:hypothetical protein
MANRFTIFLAMGATIIAMMLFYPPHTLGLMSKETLMSFNNGGMDLLPDVRGINTQGSVTYTITVKGQKKDGDSVLKADIVVENTHTRNSTKARVHYRASGKYVYETGGSCRTITTLTLQSDETVLELPADSYAMAPMYTSKKKGIARLKLPDFASGFPPKYKARSSGCNPPPPDSGEFHDIYFLYGGMRIPSFGITNTEFAQSLNYYEQKATAEELSGFVEANFDGKRSRGAKTFDLIDGMTPAFFKASGEEVHEGTWKATLTVSWDLGGEGETTIKIVSPKPDEDQVFKSGKLVINAEAKVEPSKYEKDVVWEIGDVQGSKKTVKPTKGSKVTITFDKLPTDNNQFGEKLITAKVNGKQDQVKVRFFFEPDPKDNPEGKYPNWFYYWKQGVVKDLNRFTYDPNLRASGEHNFAENKLLVGPLASKPMIPVSIPLKGKCSGQFIVIPKTEGVDTAARTVAHELEHERLFKSKKQDRDGDGVDDNEETHSPYCLDPAFNKNTHGLTAQMMGINDPQQIAKDNKTLGEFGDNELLAIAAEQKYSERVQRDKDWASPGSQSKKAR